MGLSAPAPFKTNMMNPQNPIAAIQPRFSSRAGQSEATKIDDIDVDFDQSAEPHQKAKLKQIFDKYSGPLDPQAAKIRAAKELADRTPPKNNFSELPSESPMNSNLKNEPHTPGN